MPAKSKRTKKSVAPEANRLVSVSSMLFGGGAVILVGVLQSNDDIKLLLIGFGAALLVVSAALASISISNR